MSLLLPSALLGLLTLPVILLLHLLRNRRQRLDIPSLQLWRGLDRKRQGALPRSIPLSWMLLLQLLVAIGLTVALARPALSFLQEQPRQTLYLLDTTTSMLSTAPGGAGGPRFDVARQTIAAHLARMGEQETLAVIALNARPQVLFRSDRQGQETALATLQELVPGGTGIDLAAALTLANGLVDPRYPREIHVLTDGTYTVEPGSLPAMRAPVTWQGLAPPGTSAPNQALMSVSSRQLPDGRHRVFSRVVNYAGSPVVRTLRIRADGRLLDETTVTVPAQGETARVWSLPATASRATVELAEADALAADNRAELWLAGEARHDVLLLSDNPDTLARALEAQPNVRLTAQSWEGFQPGAPEITGFDLLVLDGLPLALTAWPAGNLLVVDPPLGHPLLPAQNFGRSLRPELATTSDLLSGVDLSGVFFNRAPQLDVPEWAQVDLQAASGQPLIFHGTAGAGQSHLVVWAFDLVESNLPARLALPLLTANTLSTLLATAPPPTVSVGEPVRVRGDLRVETPAGQRLAPVLSSSQGQGESAWFGRTQQPGLYHIYDPQDSLVAGFAAHAGSALESNLAVRLVPEELAIAPGVVQPTTQPETLYQEFWHWLAGLALVLLTLEGWLAWRR